VAVALVTTAFAVPNITTFDDAVVLKFWPVIVTVLPAVPLTGVNDVTAGGARDTETDMSQLLPFTVYVIIVLPEVNPETTPAEETVATLELLLDHVPPVTEGTNVPVVPINTVVGPAIVLIEPVTATVRVVAPVLDSEILPDGVPVAEDVSRTYTVVAEIVPPVPIGIDNVEV
jgi:hypothetical protein